MATIQSLRVQIPKMVLKIHGPPSYPAVLRVQAVCKEKQVPYEIVQPDVATKEWRKPAFREKQPFGVVPYIDDDGFILYESRAIGRYIATKYAGQGTPLIPTETKAYALFEQAASTELCNFDEYARPLAFEKVYNPVANEENVAKLLKMFNRSLDVYDVILAKQRYLGGDEITLADIFHLPYGSVFVDHIDAELFLKRPNVSRWWKDISSRPSWQALKADIAA